VSRLETLKVAERELGKIRETAKHPDDAMLRYLIDMAIAEVRSALQEQRDTDTGKLFAFDARLARGNAG